MNCERYQEWLHLQRPGELSREEQGALERHLATCARCSAMRERIAAADRMLARLRDPLPQPPETDVAAREILRAIAVVGPRRHRSLVTEAVDFLVLFFDRPRLRLASAALVGLLGGMLLYQQISLVWDVAILEERMAASRRAGIVLEPAFLVRPETVSRIPRAGEILEALGAGAPPGRGLLLTRDEARSLQEAFARGLFHSRQAQDLVGKNRAAIDELVRSMMSEPRSVLRLVNKGGA
jgi:hypothetical protein